MSSCCNVVLEECLKSAPAGRKMDWNHEYYVPDRINTARVLLIKCFVTSLSV